MVSTAQTASGGDVHDSDEFDHSVRDGFFDGSGDDIEDFGHDGFSRSRRRSGLHDLSGAPSWVKAFVWAGALLAIAGLGVFMFGVLAPTNAPEPLTARLTPAFPTYTLPPGFPTEALPAHMQPPAPTGFPSSGQLTPASVGGPNVPLGFGLFFAGFVLSAIGALGHSTSKRR